VAALVEKVEVVFAQQAESRGISIRNRKISAIYMSSVREGSKAAGATGLFR
jgi:hypothetical protein